MKVECLQDQEAFGCLAAEWDALHARSATATLYNSLTYAQLWWRHFGTPGALQLWTVRDGETLVGIAPLYETTNEEGEAILRLVGGVDVSDYLDLILEPTLETNIVAALLARWADVLCPSLIDLHALPHASPSREAFLSLAGKHGFEFQEVLEDVCPVLALPQSWEAYLQQLEGKQRREIKRKLRKAGQEALVSWYQTPPALVAEEMTHFFRLHTLSSPDKASFMTSAMRTFFLELAVTLSQEGKLDLSFLLVNGHRAAVLLAFSFRNSILLYNSGFDQQLAPTLSLGWLLLSYHIEYAIAQGYQRYDFMRGDEEYKFRFGAKSEPIYHLRMRKT